MGTNPFALIGGGKPALALALLMALPNVGGMLSEGVVRWDGENVGDVGDACVGDCGLIPGSDVGTEGSARLDDAPSTASPAPASARFRSAILPPLAVDTLSSFARLLYHKII